MDRDEPLHSEIEQLATAGASLDDIESRVVGGARIDEERRAALWLYAQDRVERRLRPAVRLVSVTPG